MIDYVKLFGPAGDLREYMRSHPNGGGDWVDGFCDGIIRQLETGNAITELLTEFNCKAVNLGINSQGQPIVSIRERVDDGFKCYAADSFNDAVDMYWSEKALIMKAKEEDGTS